MQGDNTEMLADIVRGLPNGTRYEITSEANTNNFTVKFFIPQESSDALSDGDLESITGGATQGQLEKHPVFTKSNSFNTAQLSSLAKPESRTVEQYPTGGGF